jgi:anti-sigma factor RsiW
MNRLEMTTNCSNVLERIEPYLDGELGATERATFESHVLVCVDCGAELALARRLDMGLNAITLEACPPSVTAAVFAHAKANPHPKRRPWWSLVWRPALAGAVAAILLFITGYVGNNGKVSAPQYSRAELEQAREQAKWTLVFINQLSRSTAADLKRDVLEPEVSERLLRVIDPKSTTAPKEISHAI